MSLVLVDKIKFAALVDTFVPNNQKVVVNVLDHYALRLVRYTGEFFNGVRTPTNLQGDYDAIADFNKKRKAKADEMKSSGKTDEQIDDELLAPAEIPSPALGMGEWFTIAGETKYLMTHQDGVWLSWTHNKTLYLSPIARDEVKAFGEGVALKVVLVPTKTFCVVGE